MIRAKFLVGILAVGFFLFNICNGPILIWNNDFVSEGDAASISSIEGNNPVSSFTRSNNWYIQTVYSDGIVGDYSSIAIDTMNFPHISYYERSNFKLKYAYYDGLKWNNETVDSMGGFKQWSCLEIGSNNNPHIIYADSGVLKYAHLNMGQWYKETVSNSEVGIDHPSMVLDSDNNPHACYYEDVDGFDGNLKYAFLDGGQWYNETIAPIHYNSISSIALDSLDNPHLIYYNRSIARLTYTFFDGVNWITEILDDSGGSPSLVLDTFNNPHIIYSAGNLKYAYRNDSGWHTESVGVDGGDICFALDTNNNPHVSYGDGGYMEGNVKYAYYDGIQWQRDIVDLRNNLELPSMALDANDNPHVSYYDETEKDLKYAIIDNVEPILLEDISPERGTTGDEYNFDIKASDNIFVSSINISWTHGDLDGNVKLNDNENNKWNRTITLDDSLDDLTYYLQIDDIAGNSNITGPYVVPVSDNDKPVLGDVDTTPVGTTGDIFQFKIKASDNVEVASVHVNWSHGELKNNLSLNRSRGLWVGSIILDHCLTDLFFSIHILDTSNLSFTSTIRNRPVTDNDNPIFGTPWNSILKTGRSALFSVNITEKPGLDSVRFDFSINNRTHYNWPVLNNTGASWRIIIPLPSNAISIEFYFEATDISNNTNRTNNISLEVYDHEIPVVNAGTDEIIEQYKSFIFNGSLCSDNIGIVNYTWMFTYENRIVKLYGKIVSFPFDMDGIFNVTLNAFDAAGNLDTDVQMITVNYIPKLIANAGENQTAEAGTKIILNGSFSTDVSRITGYEWTFEHSNILRTLSGMIVNFTFDKIGIYQVELTVTDIEGKTATDFTTVTIKDTTSPTPVSSANRYKVYKRGMIYLDGSESTDNSDIVNWTWTISSEHGTFKLYGEEVNYLFDELGTYKVSLTVYDAEGNVGYNENANFDIVVGNNPIIDEETSGKEDSLPTWGKVLVASIFSLMVGFVIVLILKKRKGNASANGLELGDEKIISKSEEDVDEIGRVKPSTDVSGEPEEEGKNKKDD